MLTDVENGVVAVLDAAGLGAKDLRVRSKGRNPALPAIYASCQSGSFTKVTLTRVKCELSLSVLFIFENFEPEDKRRAGMNAIFEGAIFILQNNKLGLDILPLKLVRFRDVTTEEEAAKGLLYYLLELSTVYELNVPDAEAAAELLKVGLNYYLQDPVDDHIVDGADDVTLQGTGGNT
jgi:hypothetical protein